MRKPMSKFAEKVHLPSRKQSQTAPTRPILTALDVLLAMTIDSLYCQHLGLDQLLLFIGCGLVPKRSTHAAERIVDQAEELRKIIETYLCEIEKEQNDMAT